MDKSNFFSLVSKFVYDVMTRCEVWDDDNDDQIINECQLQTKTDVDNPRAELVFTRAIVEDDPDRWRNEFFRAKVNTVGQQKERLRAAGASKEEVHNKDLRLEAYDKYIYGGKDLSAEQAKAKEHKEAWFLWVSELSQMDELERAGASEKETSCEASRRIAYDKYLLNK